MTMEEAISEWTFRSNYIKKWLDEYGEEPSIRHYVELIDMAIEALSERNIAREIATILENEQDMRVMLQNDAVPNCQRRAIKELWEETEKEDLVSVVRCEDCRHRDLFSCPLADNDFQKDEDFCSWGERREE